MEGEINKNTQNAVFFLPGTGVTIAFGNNIGSLVFVKNVIQINGDGECSKEIIEAIVKMIDEGGKQ